MLTDEALKCFMEIVYVDEIDSTNAEAARRIDAGKRENWVLITTAQTAGRGRRGRVWLTPKNRAAAGIPPPSPCWAGFPALKTRGC